MSIGFCGHKSSEDKTCSLGALTNDIVQHWRNVQSMMIFKTFLKVTAALTNCLRRLLMPAAAKWDDSRLSLSQFMQLPLRLPLRRRTGAGGRKWAPPLALTLRHRNVIHRLLDGFVCGSYRQRRHQPSGRGCAKRNWVFRRPDSSRARGSHDTQICKCLLPSSFHSS